MYANHTLLSASEVKVLEVFLDLDRHYFAKLTKVTKLTRPRTLRVLRKLVKQGILDVATEANVKYYSLKRTPSVFSILSLVEYNLTQLFLSKNKTISRAFDMLKGKYVDYSVMLIFGSTVKGYATKKSDIDLLLLKEAVSKEDIKKVEDIVDLINGRTGLKISPYFMTVDEFKKKNDLAKQAIADHLLIDGAELFFRMVLENQRFSEPLKM
ncbi:MAG: nucleotidyltransferase domain-containing protein [Nanoarchaeota archaeon]